MDGKEDEVLEMGRWLCGCGRMGGGLVMGWVGSG